MTKTEKLKEKPKEKRSRESEELVNVMQALTTVMNEETALIRVRDVSGLEAIGRRKMELVRAFEKNMACLVASPEALKAVDAPMREALRHARKACEDTARENAGVLRGAMEATKSVVEMIVDAAVKKTKETDGYKDPRKNTFGVAPREDICRPVAFSRTV